MKRVFAEMKKYFSFMMAVFMIMSLTCGGFLASAVGVMDYEKGTFTVTDGQVVAANLNELSKNEKNVLNCSAVKGFVIFCAIPTENNTYVSVNAETKTVTARNFTSKGNVWVPETAELVYTDGAGVEQKEVILLEKGKGTFVSDATAYSVNVTYNIYTEVHPETQLELANAPYYITNSIIGFNMFSQENSSVATLASKIELLYKLTTGELPITLKETSCAYEPIVRLYNQTVANGGKFDFGISIDEYNKATNPLAYVYKNGETVRSQATALCDDLSNIVTEDSGIASLVRLAMAFSSDARLQTILDALDYLTLVEGNISYINENSDYWEMFSLQLIRSDATDAELDALYVPVKACVGRGGVQNKATYYSSVSTFDRVLVGSNVVSKTVDQHKVNVTVGADVVGADTVDSAELIRLAEKNVTFVLNKGATAATIQEKIEASGIITEALDSWNSFYNVGDVYYDRVISGMPEELTGDVDIKIVFTPKNINISYGYKDAESVPYGYNLLLEKNNKDGKSYDYTVNSQRMWEGSVIRLEADVEVNRLEADRVYGHKLTEMVSDSAYPGMYLNAYEKDVLAAGALDDDTYYYRTPDMATWLVEAESKDGIGYVSCENYSSGLLSDAEWVPICGTAYDKNGAVIADFDIVDGKGVFAAENGFERVAVKYHLYVPDVSYSDLDHYVNLIPTLEGEARSQYENLSAFTSDEAFEAISEANGEKIDMLLTYGEDSYRLATKNALRDVKDNCIDMSKDGQPLYLYDFVAGFMENGLAEYYKPGVAEMVIYQYNLLLGAIDVIWEDPAFQEDLVDSIFSDYGNAVRYLKEALGGLIFLPVNEHIDRTSDNLGEFAAAILGESTSDFHEVDNLVIENTVVARNLSNRVVVTVDTIEHKAFEGDTMSVSADAFKMAGNGHNCMYFNMWKGDGVIVEDASENATDIIVMEAGGSLVSEYRYVGDVDVDGLVNAEDIFGVQTSILGENGGEIEDVNFDGTVDAKDLVALKLMILGLFDYSEFLNK